MSKVAVLNYKMFKKVARKGNSEQGQKLKKKKQQQTNRYL